MKKLIVLMVLFAVSAFGQAFQDLPQYYMLKDTFYTVDTRATHDFPIYTNDSYATGNRLMGPIDLHIYSTLESDWTLSGSDTLTVEMYGIVRRAMQGSTTVTTNYVDSTRVSSTVYADSVFHAIPLDPLFTDFPIYDGIRIVVKKGGSDPDSANVWSGLRVWKQGGPR